MTPKTVLTQRDIFYLGLFKLPERVGNFPTNHSTGGLSCRYVSNRLRFFTTVSERWDEGNNAVYEVQYPGSQSPDLASAPIAPIADVWGDIYGGLRTAGHPQTYGLLWDELTRRLYWSCADFYLVDGSNPPTLGWTDLASGTVHGLWNTDQNVQRVRGGAVILPSWFTRHTGGNRLALGFGGLYNGSANCSFGPSLVAIPTPQDGVPMLGTQRLVNYPCDPRQHFSPRDGDYWYDSHDWWWARWPDDPQHGYWNFLCDEITGAGCIIDTPTKQGYLTIANQGHGHTWYDHGYGSRSDFQWTMGYIYDLNQLAEIADGARDEWSATASYWAEGPEISDGGVHGCCYDPVSGNLFVLDTRADFDGFDFWPCVLVYRIAQ